MFPAEQVLERHVSEVLQMRVAAKAWNDPGRSGPCCELLFFLMGREPGDEP